MAAVSRAFLFETGEVFASFEDGISILLLSDGLSLILLQNDGSEVRFSTRYAPNAVFQRVEPMLLFRNLRGGSPLLFDRQISASGSQTKIPIIYAHWPSSSDEANITKCPGGSAELTSLCGTCTVALLPGKRWFTVEWPVLMSKVIDLKGSENGRLSHTYDYINTVELHPLSFCPREWQHPVNLLLKYGVPDPEAKFQKENAADSFCAISPEYPRRASTSKGPSWECALRKEDVSLLHCGGKLPQSPACLVQWTPDALIQLHSGPKARIEVLVHRDLSSIFSTDMQYFHHELLDLPRSFKASPSFQVVQKLTRLTSSDAPVRMEASSKGVALTETDTKMDSNAIGATGRNEKLQKLYASNSLPTFHRTEAVCYPIKKIIEYSQDMYQKCCLSKSLGSSNFMHQNNSFVSNDIIREHYVKGLGLFTAFKDRRVRAKFVDRTLGEWTPSDQICTLLLSSGDQKAIPFPSASAKNYMVYIRPMVQFMQIASLSDSKIESIKSAKARLKEVIDHRRRCSAALLTAKSSERHSVLPLSKCKDRLCEMKILLARATAGADKALRDALQVAGKIDRTLQTASGRELTSSNAATV